MNKKTKIIIIVSLVLVLLAAAAVTVIVLKSGKKEEEEESFEVWKQLPYVYTESREESSYGSYKEAFADVIQKKIYLLMAKAEKSTAGAGITGAYFSDGKVPTVVLSYMNGDGKLHFLILKYSDNKLYELDRKTAFEGLSAENKLLIYENCDLIAERSGIGTAVGTQVLIDFNEGDYCAVRDNEYENGPESDMDKTVEEYNSGAGEGISFADKAVVTAVTDYLGQCLGTSFVTG